MNLPPIDSLAILEKVGVRLGGRPVLHGVDLGVAAGEVLGLVGPNGAGKTSLLRILAGLLKPERGRVVGPPGGAGSVGYLPQEGEAHWPVTVRHLVSLGRLPHLGPFGRPGASDAACIDAALEATDVAHLADRTMAEVSGGERARVHLARVLAGTPRLILADEPVAGLDPRHQLEVMALFRDEAAKGRGVVMVVHDLSLAGRFCDRIVLLDCGRIAAEGPPAEVLTADRIAGVYGVRTVTMTVEGRDYVLPWTPLARTLQRPAVRSDQPVAGAHHQ